MMRPVYQSSDALRKAGRDVHVPFDILLDDGEPLTFLQILRLLPGKRLSGVARWRNTEVFAKLFVSDQAQRHAQREQDGCLALIKAGIPTPSLLSSQTFPGGGYAVLTTYLREAEPLDAQTGSPLLEQAFALVGRLHAASLVHEDLHLGNFLHRDGQIHLVDGDAVAKGNPLDNLALLLSQMPAAAGIDRTRLLAAYGRPVDQAALAQRAQALTALRLQRFLAKTVRDCTEFAVSRSPRRFVAMRRDNGHSLDTLLANPDACMTQGACLKDGGTCTVTRASIGSREVVIKRYNLKNWRHALSRSWRSSRAWHSWREAHRLLFLGLATPRPLALIEERLGPLRGRAFYITEFAGGPNLLEALDPDQEPGPAFKHALTHLFQALREQRISHGDLKATNLLWIDGRIVLIDLDAMRQHHSTSAYQRAWKKDRDRLLRNWPAHSDLVHWLDSTLPRP
jgi:tRNA A-37 threonylcarbamoyl transferase component Bud32